MADTNLTELHCSNCNKAQKEDGSPLMKCSGCSKVAYCSKECQKKDWKDHKKVCRVKSSSSGGTKPSESGVQDALDAYNYLNKVAPTVPEARELAKSMGITLGGGTASPLRRLIITGNDTPENMALVFGPNWRASMQSQHEEARIEVLIKPAPGSPSYCVNYREDKGTPKWSPRPATEAEKSRVAEVKSMQETIRQKVGAGNSPSNADMVAILTAFGGNWVDKLPTYQLALNTIDQGVDPVYGATR